MFLLCEKILLSEYPHQLIMFFMKEHIKYYSLLQGISDPNPEHCGDCEHIKFCGNCIVRGLKKYREIKHRCVGN